MKPVMCREWYRLCHSKKLWFILFFMLFMSIWMFFISIGWKKEVLYVWLDETEEDKEALEEYAGELAQDIVDRIGTGHSDHNIGEPTRFWLSQEAMELFREGGALYEKYQMYHFPDKMVLQQEIGGAIAPPEQEDFVPGWRFDTMLTDFSAAGWSAIIFTALFFGMDFSTRTCQGALFTGKQRRKLFWGKYLSFFLLFAVLSLAELAVAIAVFIPDIGLLPVSDIVKGLLLRCLVDTGRAVIFVPLALLGKSEWKAFGLILAFSLIFMSGMTGRRLDPYPFTTEIYWKTFEDIRTTINIVVMTVAVFFGAGFFSAELFERIELK